MRTFLTVLAFLLTSQSAFALWCDVYVRDAERRFQIPEHLLTAMSWSESGQYISKVGLVAWPWTINVNGKGYIFETKEKAIQAVMNFQRKGIKSIDVGCMQVNLKHHPTAFKSLQEAFDPKANVEYAARFVTGLKNQFQSWYKAVAHYHSATPSLHEIYRKKVLKNWEKAKLQLTNQSLSPNQQNLLLVNQQLGGDFAQAQQTVYQTNGQSVRPLNQQFNAMKNYPVVIQQQGQKQVVNNMNKGRFIPVNRMQSLPVNKTMPAQVSSNPTVPQPLSKNGSIVQITNKRFYPVSGDTVIVATGKRFIPVS